MGFGFALGPFVSDCADTAEDTAARTGLNVARRTMYSLVYAAGFNEVTQWLTWQEDEKMESTDSTQE